MNKIIPAVPLGTYVSFPPNTLILYTAPVDMLNRPGTHIVALGKWDTDYTLVFASWMRDHRCKSHEIGTWFISEINLTQQQLRLLRKINFGS